MDDSIAGYLEKALEASGKPIGFLSDAGGRDRPPRLERRLPPARAGEEWKLASTGYIVAAEPDIVEELQRLLRG